MTITFPVTKTGLGLAAASFLGLALLAAPVRADDKVLAKVNGAEIKQSDVAMAEEELAPSLAQMDPATKDENVLAFLIDMKIVAKAAEDRKIADTEEFKRRLNFTRSRLLMDSLLAVRGQGRDQRCCDEAGLRGRFEADFRRAGGARPPHPGRDRG